MAEPGIDSAGNGRRTGKMRLPDYPAEYFTIPEENQ
jgi:hypothetical protein